MTRTHPRASTPAISHHANSNSNSNATTTRVAPHTCVGLDHDSTHPDNSIRRDLPPNPDDSPNFPPAFHAEAVQPESPDNNYNDNDNKNNSNNSSSSNNNNNNFPTPGVPSLVTCLTETNRSHNSKSEDVRGCRILMSFLLLFIL